MVIIKKHKVGLKNKRGITMDTLLRKYNKIYTELDSLNRRLVLLYQQAEANRAKYLHAVSDTKQKLENDLKENKCYMAKVNAFMEIARTHSLTHVNANSAKPFNSGVLSRLSVQINSNLPDDPYAVQLYTEATAQLIYLNAIVESLTKANCEYVNALTNEFNRLNSSVENQIFVVKEEINRYLSSVSFSSFLEVVQNDKNVFGGKLEKTSMTSEQIGTISLGTVEIPLPIPRGMETKIVERTMGQCNVGKSTIMIPMNVAIDEGLVILAEYVNSTEMHVLQGVQNIILNVLRHYREELTQVTFIDPIRFNASSLGCLSALCGDDSIIDTVPISEEEVRKKIKSLVLSVNKKNIDGGQKSDKRVYIFHDFPQAYDSASISLIQQLCANAEYYGIIVVITHNQSANKQVDSNIYQFIKNIATNITVEGNDNFGVAFKNEKKHEFSWYLAPASLPNDVENLYIYEKPVADLDNDYIKRVGFDLVPNIKKGVRRLSDIPYGLDNNGNILYLDFENSNFATYICGAARSGKSTLIHTIITGILKTTHPDNVEIWLVDFGKTEFSRYVNKNIPHIRYIILDESPELVYDLVDRLTEIMLSRQNKFMGKWEKLSDVPLEKYMPELFVIIDEFSIMSNILASSVALAKEDYRIKLQTILAKSAKLGMRFIFSSQGFTEGTRGLTEMAKDQIQQRIAMKAEYSDIKSTLDLKTISERDEFLMEQLPVHYALKRIPLTEQGDRLSNAHVLYIPNVDSQLPLIEAINRTFLPQKVYDISNFESYIHKRPMIKDGNTFEVFTEQTEAILEYLDKSNINEDEKNIAIFIGSPQRMLKFFPIEIVDGFCENCLLIVPTREKLSGSSLIMSSVCSLNMQEVQTECWTLGKNPIYRLITTECKFSFDEAYTRIEDICTRISCLKEAIENKIESNKMVFIMNYETIMMDMQYLTEETKLDDKNNLKVFNEFGSISRDNDESDLNTLLDLELGLESETHPDITTIKSSVTLQISSNVRNVLSDSKVYDARNDLIYILTHGPKRGYHFVMQFDSCGDFRQAKLNESLFRHRIMFQTAKSEAVGIVTSSFAESVSNLTKHIFRYTNGIDEVSFRPYLHNGLCIDGWSIKGQNADDEEEDYLE